MYIDDLRLLNIEGWSGVDPPAPLQGTRIPGSACVSRTPAVVTWSSKVMGLRKARRRANLSFKAMFGVISEL